VNWMGLGICAAALWMGGWLQAAAAHGHSHTASSPAGTKNRTAKTPLPLRKTGLWEVTVRSDDLVLRRSGQSPSRPQTVRMCTDPASEPIMLMAILPGQEDCHEINVRRRPIAQGQAYNITTVCYVHETRIDAQMDISGDLKSSYQGSFNVKYPQTPLRNSGRMVFEGKHLGACTHVKRARAAGPSQGHRGHRH
jgi:hypothetical protein